MGKDAEIYGGPSGFIAAYSHKEDPVFVQVGEGKNQGYFVMPEDAEQKINEPNLIVSKASILMAKRMVPGVSWGAGIGYLEVGTGVGTGTQQAPQAESTAQAALRVALARKAVASWTYLDGSGNPTATSTNVIQLTTTFENTEAVGALVEMGLFGGDASATITTGYMFNYKTFPVWNKDNTMKLTIVWTLTF